MHKIDEFAVLILTICDMLVSFLSPTVNIRTLGLLIMEQRNLMHKAQGHPEALILVL
jgi:hypothetical protein